MPLKHIGPAPHRRNGSWYHGSLHPAGCFKGGCAARNNGSTHHQHLASLYHRRDGSSHLAQRGAAALRGFSGLGVGGFSRSFSAGKLDPNAAVVLCCLFIAALAYVYACTGGRRREPAISTSRRSRRVRDATAAP